ncbi:MAG: phosphoenolpyruvate--protein phosphotransferase [Bradymonadia bacterium]
MSDQGTPVPRPRLTYTLKGIAVSPGYAIGRAHRIEHRQTHVPQYHVEAESTAAELVRLETAIESSDQQLVDIKQKLGTTEGEDIQILDAHRLMLRDEMLVGETRRLIQDQHLNSEWALKKTIEHIKSIFSDLEDEYLRSRQADVDFVGDRIMRNLSGSAHPRLGQVHPDAIIIAHDLSPADTAFLLHARVQGFAIDVGGATSHTAIMARSLRLPAVVGLEQITEHVGTGDMLVLDGCSGRLMINPTDEELDQFRQLKTAFDAQRARVDAMGTKPAVTKDGRNVKIAGNIELWEETALVQSSGAEGVGLYRTEYLYMNRETLPDENEQYEHYRRVIELCRPHTATIRTLDLGGDKFINPLQLAREMNPVMGLRAIRLCLKEQDIFRTQIRALLRASAHGSLRIMVPLVSELDEVRTVKRIIAECRREVAAKNQRMASEVPFGIMIEVPSAAVMADHLAREVDFFAIGTNDLVQYTLAIDRSNEHVAHLYHPLHPAVFRLLDFVIQAGKSGGVRVSLCGEMAGDPFCTPVLLGLGLDEMSMNAASIPVVKTVIRMLSLKDCRALVEEIKQMETTVEIETRVADWLEEHLDDRIPKEIFDPKKHMLTITPAPKLG